MVLESDDELVRQDYSAEAWKGAPEGAIGWWKNRMPTADEKRMVPAPPEMLVDLLHQMGKFPQRAQSRYLLALMLMRRKIVRPIHQSPKDNQTMLVEVIADNSRIEIPVCEIDGSQAEELRGELNELLYCEAEPDEDDPVVDEGDG